MKDLKLYPIKPIDGQFVMDENHHMVFIPDQPAQTLVESPNDLKELRLYRAALMILLRDPNVRCSLVCDGDCIDCMTSASGTPRGFRIRQDLLKEKVGDSVYDV